jgi:hypothetical protein
MTAKAPRTKAARERLPTLSELAKPIFNGLGPIRGISKQDLNRSAQTIIGHAFAEFTQIPSLQRRIYDVLSVMRALDARHEFRRPVHGPHRLLAIERIRQKENELQKKQLMQAQYQWLITRNSGSKRPHGAVSFPIIVVAIPLNAPGSVECSFNKRCVIINSDQPPKFLGPIEIVAKLREIPECNWRSSTLRRAISRGKTEEREKERSRISDIE